MKKTFSLFSLLIMSTFLYQASACAPNNVSNQNVISEYYYTNQDDTEELLTVNENIGYIKEDNQDVQDIQVMKEIESPLRNIDLTTPGSITFLVNKEISFSEDYVPDDLVIPNVLFNITYMDEKKYLRREAAEALEELFNAAMDSNLKLYAISGYRSYNRQKEIYESNIKTKGEEYTNRYSAKPGNSEHQSGLAMDVSTSSIRYSLTYAFATTPEGRWLANNCYKYGFIIRYPKDKSLITGYSYEPWHIRYVGKELARYLIENDLTFEEYYQLDTNYIEGIGDSYDSIIDVVE